METEGAIGFANGRKKQVIALPGVHNNDRGQLLATSSPFKPSNCIYSAEQT